MAEEVTHENHGAVVGWTSQDLGTRLVLGMESVTKSSPHSSDDVHTHFFMLDKNQAVQLGYYLFRVTGQTAPAKKKRGLLDRLFGV